MIDISDGKIKLTVDQRIKEKISFILDILSTDSRGSHSEMRRLNSLVQQQYADVRSIYGAKRGWTQSANCFSIGDLARISVVNEGWSRDFVDHRSCWEIDGRPTAVTAHLYGCDEDKREAAQVWAAHRGLSITFPTDFPSWWYPGKTTLIEITRET